MQTTCIFSFVGCWSVLNENFPSTMLCIYGRSVETRQFIHDSFELGLFSGSVDWLFVWKFRFAHLFIDFNFTKDNNHGIKLWLYRNLESKLFFVEMVLKSDSSHCSACCRTKTLILFRVDLYKFLLVFQRTFTQSLFTINVKTRRGSFPPDQTIRSKSLWSSYLNQNIIRSL